MSLKRIRVLILGAAGSDFHHFNCVFRDNPLYEVVGFTATQIVGIDSRIYPAVLAGSLYPKGIQIYPESKLEELIKELKVDVCQLSYSDLLHDTVMHLASRCLAVGADFQMLGGNKTKLRSKMPTISICAVRTGVGKSQTTRHVSEFLKKKGVKTVVSRHPMPYGDLSVQICQRFADYSDLDKHKCTIEEREEYEPHIDNGNVLYAGVDYEAIMHAAESEGYDCLLWDGGNNDIPYFQSSLNIVLADAKRPGHELKYHPGEVNFRNADVIIINKIADADPKDVELIKKHAAEANPKAKVILASSLITCDGIEKIKGKKVLIVEDGPSCTHGDLATGAASVIAQRAGAIPVNPVPYLKGSLVGVFDKFKHLQTCNILPAMGYGDQQVKDTEATIDATPCDFVLIGTPIDLTRILKINKPMLRVRYDYAEMNNTHQLTDVLEEWYAKHIKH